MAKSDRFRELELMQRLIDRLEHLSADSTYAHKASGLRGSLLKYLDGAEKHPVLSREEQKRIERLMEEGFEILELAAKEVGR